MFWFLITIILLFLLILTRRKYVKPETIYYEERIVTLLKIYIRQTVRWAYASEQDSNPLVAVLHANYANSYLMVLKDYMENFNISRELFTKLTKTNLLDLEKRVLRIQDSALRSLLRHTKKCIRVDKDNILSNMLFN